MRVIAGTYKGRRLKAVPGSSTRPTTDKIKEAMFQIMGPFFEGGACLDLFAGSGGLGIEALSRGMDKTFFIDKQAKAIQTIKENLQQFATDDVQYEVYKNDAYRALHVLHKRKERFDLILLDPPYKKVDYNKLINNILRFGLLKKGGMLYCEHDPKEQFEHFSELQVLKHTSYSHTIAITVFMYT